MILDQGQSMTLGGGYQQPLGGRISAGPPVYGEVGALASLPDQQYSTPQRAARAPAKLAID